VKNLLGAYHDSPTTCHAKIDKRGRISAYAKEVKPVDDTTIKRTILINKNLDKSMRLIAANDGRYLIDVIKEAFQLYIDMKNICSKPVPSYVLWYGTTTIFI